MHNSLDCAACRGLRRSRCTCNCTDTRIEQQLRRLGCCLNRRDREEREREQREVEEREALKNMTEAERRAWEAAHPKVSVSWNTPITLRLEELRSTGLTQLREEGF